MNWVGGARSRIKQSHERKIQKEFFERQKLAKKVNIHKQLSPKGQKKPVSLDLLSLQTINLTHGGENAATQRRQPVKVILGDRTNLLSRRQEDLELPMSPIRHPSTLMFTDIKTDKDSYKSTNKSTHPESLLQASNVNPNGSETSQAITRSNQVGHSNGVFEESLMSESLPSCHDMSWEPPPPKYLKKQPTQKFNSDHGKYQFKNRKEDLLAFQRAEKEKHMSSKPTPQKQPPHHVKPIERESYSDKPAALYDNHSEESPTAFKVPEKPPLKLEGVTYKHTESSGVSSNNGLSDKERKILLGLDFEAELDSAEDKQCVPVFKKAKTTSSFEQMINSYEKPAKNKTNLNSVSKGVAKSRHEEWRKFTHKTKVSPHLASMHQVPDTSTAMEAQVKNKTSLFFRQQAPKKQILPKKRPSTVLQELLCLDEDLNNSDLFLTQDFTFEERLDIDFEEPLHHAQEHKAQHVATIADKLAFNHYITPVEEPEVLNEVQPKEQLVQLPKSKERLVCLSKTTEQPEDFTKPKEQSVELSSNAPSTSVGIQCNRAVDVNDMETQTIGNTASVLDTGTQTEVMISKSTMTDTSELVLLPSDRHSNSPNQSSRSTDDRLALAHSTIVWQSLMIQLLKIDAKYLNDKKKV